VAASLEDKSVSSAAISGSMDNSQCRFEYPIVACLKGISRGGSAASASMMFAKSGLEKDENREIEIMTGSVVGYNMVAGSNAAGTCIRFRKGRLVGLPRRHE
jgi:hypothetical protein